MKFNALVIVAVCSLMFWGTCFAEQPSAQEEFREGISAFQAGDLKTARHHLETARQSGLASSALFYNLGVVYFRLDEYDESQAAFSRLLDTPHAPLALYNLGLVLKAKGDPEGAREWFAQAARSSSPPQIQALAIKQLNPNARDRDIAKTVERGDGSSVPTNQRLVFLSVAGGYDDNIAGTPSSETTDQAGSFAEFLASGRSPLYQSRGRALVLNAAAYSRQYSSNSDFDNTYASAGLAWQHPLESARITAEVGLSGLWFDGDLLERQVRLDVSYKRPGCFWPQILVVDCEIQGFAATIQGGAGYEAYDGSLYGGGVSFEKAVGPWTLDASYRLEIDRREDLESGSEFFSLSPIRHRVGVSAERLMSQRLSLGASQSLRVSRYSDPHRLVEDGQIQSTRREDEKYRARVFTRYAFNPTWYLGAELAWETNQSTLARYEYDRTEFLISLDGVF
ncbi:tetratricopeptide repeat protein [Marinobacter sp. CHS3-4]|uniref:tetratricopeptide repeat protein n=1 Tax=Marinobacter sp. CHS3-4 TaxID=3045174 RepID=UPI0024B6234C|nr:tetratricopeptide repeat protein [Marinobacter sp. CHS3-4]MDI9246599.1 tetratricopeptide repeat protein [Marinobacter sp. CHS3-4]